VWGSSGGDFEVIAGVAEKYVDECEWRMEKERIIIATAPLIYLTRPLLYR
jgi:hypothetical protein